MNPFMAVLMAMLYTPYVAVSKPTIQAWARLKRAKRRWALRMPLPASWSLRLAGVAMMAGGSGTTAPEQQVTELKNEAAAKYKEAHDFAEECAKELGGTMDDLNAGKKADGSVFGLTDEQYAKFETLKNEAQELGNRAMKAGAFGDVREAVDFFYGKATGGKQVPWSQIRNQTIEVVDRPKSLGEQIAGSDEYKALQESEILRVEQMKFGQIKLGEMKATTDVIHSTSGGPGAGLVTPQYIPGVLELPARPLTVRDLFGSGQMTSDTLSYAQQTARESGAAAVAQATSPSTGAKPQSSVAYERVTSMATTIATFLAVTRQQLADAGQMQAFIDNQGRLMIRLEEEDQLINAAAAGADLDGLLNVTGVQTYTPNPDGSAGGRVNLDAIRTSKRLIRTGLSRLAADAVLLNPVDSEQFDLLTNSNGDYYGGNPIGGQAGEELPIWRLRRVESEAIAAGTGIVGAFRSGASVYERSPITVYIADQHSDWFIRNLIAVLFEERIAFPVFFPSAFVVVTFDLTDWGT